MIISIVKRIVFIYIIFSFTTNLFAEQNKIDSLQVLLSIVLFSFSILNSNNLNCFSIKTII